MTKATDKEIARRRAEKEFANQKRGDDIVAGEDSRRAADAEKTARLRKLRLVKETDERSAKAAKTKAKPSRRWGK